MPMGKGYWDKRWLCSWQSRNVAYFSAVWPPGSGHLSATCDTQTHTCITHGIAICICECIYSSNSVYRALRLICFQCVPIIISIRHDCCCYQTNIYLSIGIYGGKNIWIAGGRATVSGIMTLILYGPMAVRLPQILYSEGATSITYEAHFSRPRRPGLMSGDLTMAFIN